MNHRLGFVSIVVVSSFFAACTLGDYQPPPGTGGEGGAGAGEGGTGNNSGMVGPGGGSSSSSGAGGKGGGSSASSSSASSSGAGGSNTCAGSEPPICWEHCSPASVKDPKCIGGAWECPPDSHVAKSCTLPTGCCLTDSDCPMEHVCVAYSCKPKAVHPQCWRDEDCENKPCQNPNPCPCKAECILDTPGTCL